MQLGLFGIEGEHPRSGRAVFRRLVLWMVVCWVSGGPSFAWATMEPNRGAAQFEPAAMALGIILFAVGYTILTSTDRFDAFQRLPGVRLTLYIGYFTRLGLSILFPVALAADLFPGLLSILAVQYSLERLGIEPNGSYAIRFMATLATTCLDGAILNVIIAIYMLVVYGFVKLSGKGMKQARGFEVLPLPTARKAQERADPLDGGPAF